MFVSKTSLLFFLLANALVNVVCCRRLVVLIDVILVIVAVVSLSSVEFVVRVEDEVYVVVAIVVALQLGCPHMTSHAPRAHTSLLLLLHAQCKRVIQPSLLPSESPSSIPSRIPSENPSSIPSRQPSSVPSRSPSETPSSIPSRQ
eukprot:scaffold13616_cov490-Alexandrium_tamarense.AAC.2